MRCRLTILRDRLTRKRLRANSLTVAISVDDNGIAIQVMPLSSE